MEHQLIMEKGATTAKCPCGWSTANRDTALTRAEAEVRFKEHLPEKEHGAQPGPGPRPWGIKPAAPEPKEAVAVPEEEEKPKRRK